MKYKVKINWLRSQVVTADRVRVMPDNTLVFTRNKGRVPGSEIFSPGSWESFKTIGE